VCLLSPNFKLASKNIYIYKTIIKIKNKKYIKIKIKKLKVSKT
jgi:hypothetical protein